MRPDAIERRPDNTGPLHRLDARLKLVVALLFVVIAVATPIGSWTWLGIEGFVLALIIGLSGIPPRDLARRYLTFLALVGFLAVLIALNHPARVRFGLAVVVASILVKNSLAILAILALAGVTPFHVLLRAMRKLGLPLVLVATLSFMERYRYILAEELARMVTARRARTFSRRGGLTLNLAGGLIGLLFLRAFERAERVHGAMLARGWQGRFYSLDDETTRKVTSQTPP
jgi:cobalt/nickel transport system permease protein